MIYARIVAGLIVAALLAYVLHTVHAWHEQAAKVPVLVAKLAQERSDFEAYKANHARQQALFREISQGYFDAVTYLDAAYRARRSGAVRLCVPARADGVPTAGAVAGGADAAAAGAGVLPSQEGGDSAQGLVAGADIGPDLDDAFHEADRYLERLRQLLKLAPPAYPPPLNAPKETHP